MRVSLIVAMTPGGLIGKGGTLPWRLPEDLKHFRAVTMGHAVVMGRRTLEEIKKPLKGRRNLVVTRNAQPTALEGIEWFPSVEAAIAAARAGGETECMVIGGAMIYGAALAKGLVDRMYITWVEMTPEPEGDTWFPIWDPMAWRVVEERAEAGVGGERMRFVTYDRRTATR